MKKTLALVMALMMVLAVMTGCNSGNSENTATPATTTTPAATAAPSAEATPAVTAQVTYEVKMSIQYAPQQCVPYWYAKENGIFEKYGVKLQDDIPWYSAGAPQLEAQPGGEWDIGLIGYTAAIRAATAYSMENIGMCGFDTSDTVICREDCDIYTAGQGKIDGYPNIYGTPELWKGKKIILTLGTTRDVCMQLVLKAMGLTYDDVTIVNMDNESGAQAFKSGEGDLWVPAGSWGAQALVEDPSLKAVANIVDVDCAMFNSIVVPKDWAAENEDAVVHFLAVFVESVMWCGDEANKDTMAQYYQTIMKDEGGVDYTLEQSAACVNKVIWPDLAKYESFSTKNADGLTAYQAYCAKFFDAHALVGIADPANKQTMLDSCNMTYLDKAIALYKSVNNIK